MSEFVRAAREMSGELFTSRDPRRCSAPKSLSDGYAATAHSSCRISFDSFPYCCERCS